MKRISEILTGIFCPLFYYLVSNVMVYVFLYSEYTERYAAIEYILLIVLPALPGIALASLLVRDSLKEFFKSLGICFLASVITVLVFNSIDVDLMIYRAVTGYDAFRLEEGLLFTIASRSYIIACLAGTVISCGETIYRQIKNRAKTTKNI